MIAHRLSNFTPASEAYIYIHVLQQSLERVVCCALHFRVMVYLHMI